jgi:Resolvase, N terminal domain
MIDRQYRNSAERARDRVTTLHGVWISRRAQRAPRAPALAYCRVSTQRQVRSGLGLEAQRDAVERFAEREGYDLVGDPSPNR